MRKSFRRIAAVAMAMSMMLLAACGSTKSTTDAGTSSQTQQTGQKQLVFTWWGNQVRNERTQQVLDLYSSQNPGVTFDGQFSEFSDYWDKMATAAAGHTMPDILQMDYSYIQQYVDNGLLLDLTSYIQNGDIDTTYCNPNVIQAGKISGEIYGICNGINAPALLYNKTLLDQYGITVKDNMTMDEFVALSKEVYEKTGYKTNIDYGSDKYLSYFLRADNIVLYEQGKLGGDSADAYVDYFKNYEDGIKDGWHLNASVFAEKTVGSVEQDPMLYGSAPDNMSWCAFAYSNQYSAYSKAAAEGTELGLTTWPSKDPARSGYINPSQFFAISADCKNPEEAVKVLDFLTNSSECNNILLGERGIPVSSKITEEIAPKLDEGSQKVIQFVEGVVSPNSTLVNPPATNGSSEVKNMVIQLQEQICYGQISAEDAGKQLFEQGNQIMASK